MRPDGGRRPRDGRAVQRTAQQVVAFYLVETDDEGDLRTACERWAAVESTSSSVARRSEGPT